MSIGTTIKKLRQERNITQEKLAEYLHISSRAISQWECDRTLPDILQLPALANIFDVSADVLLGINIERNNQKIKEILTVADVMMFDGEWVKAVEYLRERHHEYPRSYAIMEKLATAIVNDNSRRGIIDYDEAIVLCKTMLDECTDNSIRNRALNMLGTAYYYTKNDSEMLEVVKQMPDFKFSKEVFMLWKLKGEQGLIKHQEYLAVLIEQIATVIDLLASNRFDNGEYAYSVEDRIKLWKQLVGIIELLFPDGDYNIFSQHAEIACSWLSQTYFNLGDVDNGFYWLEKTCDYAICMDSYDLNEVHSSPVLRGYIDGGWIIEGGCNRTAYLLNGLIKDNTIDNIKKDARYKKVISRLEQYSKKN